MESSRNFDLRLSGTLSAVSVEVIDSPAGETAAPVVLPCIVTPKALEDLRDSMPGVDLKAVGRALWRCAFGAPDVAELWRASTSKMGSDDFLRLRLMIDAAELAALPWELLYDETREHFLAHDRRTPVTRYTRLPFTPLALPEGRPLHMLFTGASPDKQYTEVHIDPLVIAREWEGIEQAVAPLTGAGWLEITIQQGATMDALRTGLLRGLDIWHFLGHGEDSGLLFINSQGRPDLTKAERLHEVLLGENVGLVVLNTCLAGAGGGQATSVAGALVRAGIPAVVAMQAMISDIAAGAFAQAFYNAIAVGKGVDQAVTAGRKALVGAGISEWWMPALFMRTPEGRIWRTDGPSTFAGQPVGVSRHVHDTNVLTVLQELYEWKSVHNEVQEVLLPVDLTLNLIMDCEREPQSATLAAALKVWQNSCVQGLKTMRDNWVFEYAQSPAIDNLRTVLSEVDSVTRRLASIGPSTKDVVDLSNTLTKVRACLWSTLSSADKRIMTLVEVLKWSNGI